MPAQIDALVTSSDKCKTPPLPSTRISMHGQQPSAPSHHTTSRVHVSLGSMSILAACMRCLVHYLMEHGSGGAGCHAPTIGNCVALCDAGADGLERQAALPAQESGRQKQQPEANTATSAGACTCLPRFTPLLHLATCVRCSH
jgi:hypothetical protein